MDSQTKTAQGFTLYSLSEYAVSITFGEEISIHTLAQISKFNASLHLKPFDGFRTAVPAYTTLSVFFDPITVIQSPRLSGINCYERVASYLKKLNNESKAITIPEPQTITIPVCYGGKFGPDLDEVAQLHGTTAAAVINAHSGATYHVHLIGFTPGFAYLGGMSEALATPRKPTPRSSVPAGSIGIAGKQTGIYPLETPGGWQLIGRTPICLFDPNSKHPARLKAGDKVVFKAIAHHEFESYNDHKNADTNH